MSVCIWSVFKLRGQTPRRSPSASSSSATGFQVKRRAAGSRSQQPKKMAVSSATSDSQTQSHSSALAASSKVGTTSTATEPASSHANSGTSPYPIKRSLNLLNYSIMGVWIAYAVTVLIPTQLLASSPVSTHPFVMVYVSVIVKLESSFEKLVKQHRKRRRKPVAEEENNDPGWGMGGGAVSIVAEAGETGEAAGGPKSGQVSAVGTAVATAVDGNGGHRVLEVGQEVVTNPTLCL
ncbi:hypothetical protein BCR44DRAFT_1423696 [Catenaria anguillulae PL171]|uniref:Uncharacterized protein n=1 Tax=Catenaria anguillulae PL171 TaxID=765915 RepID=A0A1Y2I1X0_9FUNG|nr:hypothetical protein BCR44DRAFT_1423696 [Catenaria anguillulae PL171]